MRLSLVTHTHVHVKHKSNRSKMHVCHSSLKKSYHIKPWNKCIVILFPNTFVSKKSELFKALNFTLPLQFIWDLVVNFRMSWELFHSTSAKRLLQDNFLLFSFPEPYSEMFAWKKKWFPLSLTRLSHWLIININACITSCSLSAMHFLLNNERNLR